MDSNVLTPKTPARKKSKKTLEPFKIPPSPLMESLGFGTGVTVWKLQKSKSNDCQNSPWAVKNVRRNMPKLLSKKYEALLTEEATILRNLCHENIIGFRDYMVADDGRKCLAMELGGKSLGDLIEERLENDLGPYPPHLILKVTKCVAKALEYLHDEKNILHGDIKPYNIMIKNNFEIVKLCDFGVSINLDENGVAHGYIGTLIYNAPECQPGAEGPVTCKADIFSLGLVVWEMIALTHPHTELEDFESCEEEEDFEDEELSMNEDCAGEGSENEDTDFGDDSLTKKYGTRPNLPDIDLGPEYSSVVEVFFCCTEHDPKKRPTACLLVRHLNDPKKSELILGVHDSFALEPDFPSTTWHSYVFDSGVGNREGLKLSKFLISDLLSKNDIQKWDTIIDEDGVSILGLGRNFIQVTFLNKEDNHTIIEDVHGFSSDIAVFQKWTSKSKRTENFAIVANCNSNTKCSLEWYQIKNGNLTHVWTWPFTRNVMHIKVLSFDYQLQLLIISQSYTKENDTSAEIYSFSADQVMDLWLSDKFTLDENPSTTSLVHCNYDTFLIFVFPKIEMIFIYKHYKSDSGHSNFSLYQKIHSQQVTSSIGFCFHYHCFLAVTSSDSTIYRFNDNSEFVPVTNQNFGNLRNWFVIPLKSYHKDKVLLAEGEDESDLIYLSGDVDLKSGNNFSQTVCGTDNNCHEELKKFSSKGAATFFYNDHHHIVYTTNSGNSKLLTFSVEVEPLIDNVELQLREVSSYISLLEEEVKKQKIKKKNLDEALVKISDESADNSKIHWTVKNVKTNSVSVSKNPNATIDSFEYALNKNWSDSDYSDYLDLINEPRLEKLLSNKISEIASFFQDFEKTYPVESKIFTELVLDDVSFLGSVTVNQLESFELNGIDVNDMLENSLMLGHERKIGGVKAVTNIRADHIFIQKLGNIPAYDLVFSDELVEGRNVINGMLVYENDVEILEGLELIPIDGQSEPFGLYPFHHGFSFTDEIVFDHLFITEDSIIKETLNGFPLILPVHNSPFDMFSLENINQARVETVSVENNLTVDVINGIDMNKFLKSKKFTINEEKDFSTNNLEIEYLNDVKFPEGFVRVNEEKVINIDHKNFTGSLIVERLHFQDKRSEDHLKNNLNVTRVQNFQNIEVHEVLRTSKINNLTWEQLNDVVKKENKGEVQTVTGAKHLKSCKLSKNLVLNSPDLDNVMNDYADQQLSGLSFSDVAFRDLGVTGFFDGFRIENIKQSTVRLSESGRHESTLIFEEEVEPYFSSLIISNSINKVSNFEVKNTEELIVHKNVTFEVLDTTNLVINGSLIYYNKGSDINGRELNAESVFESNLENPEIQRNKLYNTNSAEKSTIDVDNKSSGSLFENNNEDAVYILLNRGYNAIKNIVVKGNIKTHNGINGYNLKDFEKNAVHINRTNVVHHKLVFDDLVEFKELRINGRLQGFHLERLSQDLVFDPSYVFLKSKKNFIGNLTVVNKLKARTLNGHLLQKILTKEGDHSIKGSVTINGDVTVNGNISSYGSINGFPVEDVFKKYSVKHNSFIIPDDIQLHVPEIDHLVVEGAIQSNSFSSFVDEMVMIEDHSNMTAKKVFVGSVNFEDSVTVSDTLNGLNVSHFNSDIVLINKGVEIAGDLIMGKTIMRTLEVKTDFNSTAIHGFDTNEWLEESILLDKSVGISGYKKFKDVYSYGNIEADYLNNYLTVNAIPLDKEQFVPCSGHFLKLTSYSDVNVGQYVNRKILRAEYDDSVLVDVEQEIAAPMVFMNDFTVENHVIFDDTKLKNLLNVTTLHTNQTISSVILFEDTVITNSDIDNLRFINEIDITKWSKQSVSLNENQVINGSWIIQGNITVDKNVEGEGLLNDQSISVISKSIVKVRLLTMDVENRRRSDFRNQCEKIANFSHKLSLQPCVLHHLEVSQILKSSAYIESVIMFEENNNHYLMLTFFNECVSILYQWNNTISRFNFVNRMNIGPVSKWITLHNKNVMYLVTSSSNDIICEKNSKRGNIWLFDGDRYKYGHLLTNEGFDDILASEYTPGKYYTLHENGDVVEWTIEPEISAKTLVNLGKNNYKFLDFEVIGELAFTNGREIRNVHNNFTYTFSKPLHSKIAVTAKREKKLIVVPYHDELVVYENILEDRIYARIPASRVRTVVWLNPSSRHPYLLYETEQKTVEIIQIRETKILLDKIAIPMPCQSLSLKVIPRGENLHPLEFVVVIQKKKILLLETVYLGNTYIKTEDHCE